VSGAYRPDLAHAHASGFTGLAEAAAPVLVEMLRQASIESGRVVDLGCGSGVTSLALSRAGFDVVGIDASEPLLALARRTAPDARFRRGSFLREAIPPCAAVVAVGEVLSYTERDLAPLFRRVLRALAPGGLFVFDLSGPGRVADRGPVRDWHEAEDWAILVETRESAAGTLLTRRMTVFRRSDRGWRRSEVTHRQRLRRSAEVASELRAEGFAVRIRRSYAGERFAPDHYVVVARSRVRRR
jgi:SAM-dependent methyltransferase